MYRSSFSLFVLPILLVIINTSLVWAHPGNTASDGCHYCRTNCDKWGVAWNQRHCHGKTIKATVKPIAKPTPPVVINKQDNEPITTSQTSSNGDSIIPLASVSALAFAGYKLVKWWRER